MRTAARVAISLPKTLLRDLDAATRRSKRTRSALVAEAVECYLHLSTPSERDQRYIDAYKRLPEDDGGQVAKVLTEQWDRWE